MPERIPGWQTPPLTGSHADRYRRRREYRDDHRRATGHVVSDEQEPYTRITVTIERPGEPRLTYTFHKVQEASVVLDNEDDDQITWYDPMYPVYQVDVPVSTRFTVSGHALPTEIDGRTEMYRWERANVDDA